MNITWQTKKLGEICEIELGKTPYRGNRNYWDPEKKTDNVWLSIADLLNTKGNVISDSKEYISNEGAKLSKIVKKGTLLASFKLTLGRLAFTGKDLYTNEAIASLMIKNEKEILKDYLYHFLKFFDWDSETKGDVKVKGKTLNKAKLKEILIIFPKSLSDQQRIVKILDEAFEKIEKTKKNVEKSLQNSKEIFESYLQNIFTSKNNDWKENRFGEIIDLLTDYHANGSYQVLKANVELKDTEDYAWMVRSTDFENNFQKDKRYITKKSYDFLKKSKIFGNEIIICKIGNAGKVYLMPKIDRPCSLAMNSFLIRLNELKCLSEYVYQYLNSKNGREQIESRILGTTTKTITKDNVRSIIIPYPPLKEQKEIIKKIDMLSKETKKLESIYKQKLADLEELKKSILVKAFNGEL